MRKADYTYFVTFSPDIQVGMPLSSLVDKVLESKAKELLPKISDVVEKLRESKTPSTPDKSSGLSSGPAADNNTLDMTSTAKPTDLGSLPLPIDILGLSSSTSGSSISLNTKREPSDGKAPPKSKPKANESLSTKESAKLKGKPTHLKAHATVKEGLKREKEVTSEKDATAEEIKDKHKPTTKQKKTKDDSKDKGAGPCKDKPQPGLVEKPDPASHTSNKSEKVAQQEQNSKKKEPSAVKVENADSMDNPGDPKAPRRSARIASLSESVEDTAMNDDKDSDEPQGKKERSYEGDTADKSEGQVKTKRKRKRGLTKNEGQKKRQRLLSSSSDEDQDISCEYKSDEGSLSDDLRRINKTKSTEADSEVQSEVSLKRSRKRALHKVPKEDIPQSLPQKKSRRLSKHNKESSVTHTEQASEPAPVENAPKPHRRKSSQPQRLPARASKSPPVVVTRYNRQIKPNRRYLDPSGEGEEDSDLDTDTREGKQNAQQSKDSEEAYSDINSSEGACQES